MKKEIEKLQKERETLKAYIISKVESDEDWHAVIDAGMDLRDIDAKLSVYELLNKELYGL